METVRNDANAYANKILRCERTLQFILGESEVTLAGLREATGEEPETKYAYNTDLESLVAYLSRLERLKQGLVSKLGETPQSEEVAPIQRPYMGTLVE